MPDHGGSPVGQEREAFSDPDVRFVVDRLRGNRRLLWSIVALGTIGAGLYTLLVPPEYEARASLVLPAADSNNGALSLAAQFGVLPSSATGGGANVAMFASILDSEKMLNALSESSGVPKKKLRERRSVKQNQGSNLIEIRFRSGKPDEALSLCETAIDELGKFNSELQLPTKEERAKLLSEKIRSYIDRLRELEVSFQQFAKTSRSGPVSEETGRSGLFVQKQKLRDLRIEFEAVRAKERSASSAVSAAQSAGAQIPTDIPQLQKTYEQFQSAQLELLSAKAAYTSENPTVKKLVTKVDNLRNQLREEANKYAQAYRSGLVQDAAALKVSKQVLEQQIRELEITVERAPREAITYAEIQRETKFVETILLDLNLKHEQALMDEASDPNRWEVLDKPELTDKPVNKKLGLSLGIGFFASLTVGVLSALLIRPKP